MDGVATKRRRVTRACDRCHRSGIKCSPSAASDKCAACASFGSDCTYDRPIKRRGPPPRVAPYTARQGHQRHVSRLSGTGDDEDWEYEEVAEAATIEELADAFHRICYPILHPFHWPSFMQAVRAQKYRTCRPFYVTTMAVCALASARLRDGAVNPVTSPSSARGAATDGVSSPSTSAAPAGHSPATSRGGAGPSRREPAAGGPPSEAFYRAALRAFPTDLSRAPDFDYKRAKNVLSVVAIQYGMVRNAQVHLGDYLTLCAQDGFNNEARWPVGLNEIEIQERRRLFWLTYQHDVYLATTWNGIVKHRESQSTVLYPAEVDDDEITADGIVFRPGPRLRFLRGWNLVTDMYRIMEHALEQLRSKRIQMSGSGPSEGVGYGGTSYAGPGPNDRMAPVTDLYAQRVWPSAQQVLDVVGKLYDTLPPEFKHVRAMTGDIQQDFIGFQGVNIISTLQTMKMVLAGLDEASSVEKRCAIAGELLDAFAAIPTAYIYSVSSPTLHHLAGVGHLLGSVIQSPLSPWSYLQVRHVLLAMADLLSSLEAVLSNVPGIADKLRAHVSRIDQYMSAAAAERARSGVSWGFLPPATAGAEAEPEHVASSTAECAYGFNRGTGVNGNVEHASDGADPRRGSGAYAPNTSAVREQSRSAPSASMPPVLPLYTQSQAGTSGGVGGTQSETTRRRPHAAARTTPLDALAAATNSLGGIRATAETASSSGSALSLDELVAAATAASAVPPLGRAAPPFDLGAAPGALGQLPALPSLASLPSLPSTSSSYSTAGSQTLGTLSTLMSASAISPAPIGATGQAPYTPPGSTPAAWTYPPLASALPGPTVGAGANGSDGAPSGMNGHAASAGTGAGPGPHHDAITLPNDLWLPPDLWVDWPFEMGQGDAFDFLGEWGEAGETG